MEKVIVIKDLTYGGGVTAIKDAVSTMPDGTIGIFNALTGALFPAITVDAGYVDVKEFQIAWNIGGTVFLTQPIKRRGIRAVETGAYIAPVFHKVQAGGTTALLAFNISDSDVGDVSITVADKTFSGMYQTATNNASIYKKASMTEENVVDALVVKLNANTNLPVTAAKITGGAGIFGITIESKERGQILSLMGGGLLEGMNRDVDGTNASVLPVNGAGVAVDVLAHEKEASVYHGNSNSRELTDSWYSQGLGTVALETYETIHFSEDLDRPYRGETNVKPSVTIYAPNGSTVADNVLTILNKLVAGAFTEATTIEPGNA